MSGDHTKPRFRCKCRPGYKGKLCQDPIKSCRGYINGGRIAEKYKVLDDNMKLFEVFCDFDTNSKMAWTLIQSYQLQNNDQFKNQPFSVNFSVHEDTPTWDAYRLSKPRMKSIQRDSTKWRMTCRYDTDGLNYTDYVRGSNDKINILTYDGDNCEEVEFFDVRGYQCENCTVLVAHRGGNNNFPLHIDSYYSKVKGCSFQPNNSKACVGTGGCNGQGEDNGKGEDNFGFYICINPLHRCSASNSSTTHTWFGGKYQHEQENVNYA